MRSTSIRQGARLAVPAALLLCALSACALFLPKFQTPRLSIVDVQLLKSDFLEQRFKVRVRVQNPNDRMLPVKGLSYTLDVAGQPFASGVSGASFVVPALGEADFDMNVTANMASTVIRLLSRSSEGGQKLDYRLAGRISLSQGVLRSIPFEQRGTLSF